MLDFLFDALLHLLLPQTPWRWFVRVALFGLIVIAVLAANDRGVFS